MRSDPANDVVPVPPPRWLPLAVEAQRRGLSTEALRRWCYARGVSIRQGNARDAWVSPEAIDAAVEALPVARAPGSSEARDAIDADLDASLARRR
jgi:hypothetical protein